MSLSTKALAFALFTLVASTGWWWDDENDDDGFNNNIGDRFGRGDHNPSIWFNGDGNSGGNTGVFSPNSFGNFDLNKSYRKAARVRIAHAALASAAFVFFFPVGAIAVRLLPGRLAWIVHALCQLFAYLLYTVAFALGIWMSLYMSTPDYKLIRLYHPIIGIVIWCLLFFQPISGFLHHRGFKRHGTRTGISHFHIGLGRLLITFGMINGGLGLMLAGNASRGQIIAYGVVAGVMWLLWMVIAVFGELRRRRKGPVAVDKVPVGPETHRNGTSSTYATTSTNRRAPGAGVARTNSGGVEDSAKDTEKYA